MRFGGELPGPGFWLEISNSAPETVARYRYNYIDMILSIWVYRYHYIDRLLSIGCYRMCVRLYGGGVRLYSRVKKVIKKVEKFAKKVLTR